MSNFEVNLRKVMSRLKMGVIFLLCSRILFDKSNLNRHHLAHHRGQEPAFETNVAYLAGEGNEIQENISWELAPLPAATFEAASAAPGCLERQTKILSRAAALFSDEKWLAVGQPSLECKDAAEQLLDEIDDFALVASTAVRSQVMRSKSNSLKNIPFQPLKDFSGISYSATLAKFFVFAKIFWDTEKGVRELVIQALTEKTSASKPACLESFVLCLAHVAPNHGNADQLQHAAMHMRRVLRGCAMLYLQSNPDVDIGSFCEEFLNMTKPSSFGVLSVMYYEVKRCVSHDKRLLIHRCEPDDGYPEGSAVLVDTGEKLVRVSYAMMRNIVNDTLRDVTTNLDEISLPGSDLVLESIVDLEDSAIGAGLLSMNKKLFDDNDQVSVLCQ